jgi:tetratricopeptide (TPR) repeat protein
MAALAAAWALAAAAGAQAPGAAPAAGASTNAPEPVREMTEAERKAQPQIEEGFFQSRLGNHEGAAAAFRRALEADPRNRRAMFGLGTACIALGRYAEAIEILQRAVDTDRTDYFAMNNLAWLHATARDIRFRDGRRAVALAREALMIAPMDFHVWSTLSEGYYVSGDYPKARRAAEEALRIARDAGTPASGIQEYEQQVQRCRAAAEAMDILE